MESDVIGSDERLQLKWLDFKVYNEEIKQLRRRIFLEEQGFDDFVLEADKDFEGLHLGLLDKGQLVSCISLFIYDYKELPEAIRSTINEEGYYVQFSRRVELPEYRNKRYASVMVAHAFKSLYELIKPRGVFATLMGKHINYKDAYIRSYHFNIENIVETPQGECVVLVLNGESNLERMYKQLRMISTKFSDLYGLDLPELEKFSLDNLSDLNRKNLNIDQNNHYLNTLSLDDELPRLSAQTRLLFGTQYSVWERIFNEHTKYNEILDVGCGLGIYLSSLSKLPGGRDKHFTGMDVSQEMITYATYAHPNLKWLVGSVYETNFSENSFDIIHCSFLFIHLLQPFNAIIELFRILRPGGLLYVSDVNDSTFDGPRVISRLVKKHAQVYEGNRMIMDDLTHLAINAGFEKYFEDRIRVYNTGQENQPDLGKNIVKLGKWTMWGLFSFMGQRREVKNYYDIAEEFYNQHNQPMSICIETKIFQKPVL